ncbi:MAG: MFS transporter [Verrucomicrobiota bacterium]|nr:MFS transporter [Verrucomicrobiota bacterium]
MLPLIRSLLAPLMSLVLLIMASGLFNTFVSIRLEMEGYSPETIGMVVSALYVGILLGSLRVDRWIAAYGHTRSFIAFALASTALVLAQSFWVNAWYWSGLRLVGGLCMAGILVVIESWLLIQSTATTRGAILSIYLGIFYGALSLGQFLLNVADPSTITPFLVTAFLCACSIFPLLLSKTAEPSTPAESVRLTLPQLFRLSPLGFFGGIISGMLLAAIYGLVPVYAKEIGLSIPQISNLMAVIIFGGLSLQWPLGRWADRGKRRRILTLASFLSALFALTIPLFDHQLLLFLLGFAFGGFAFTLYPLSMAYTCENVQNDQIIAATGGFVLSYSLGAIAGPLLSPLAMELFGPEGLFYFLATISLGLGLLGLRKPAKVKVPEKECDY